MDSGRGGGTGVPPWRRPRGRPGGAPDAPATRAVAAGGQPISPCAAAAVRCAASRRACGTRCPLPPPTLPPPSPFLQAVAPRPRPRLWPPPHRPQDAREAARRPRGRRLRATPTRPASSADSPPCEDNREKKGAGNPFVAEARRHVRGQRERRADLRAASPPVARVHFPDAAPVPRSQPARPRATLRSRRPRGCCGGVGVPFGVQPHANGVHAAPGGDGVHVRSSPEAGGAGEGGDGQMVRQPDRRAAG